MDAIHECFSLDPDPSLVPAFSAFKFVWSEVKQAQASKRQLETLAQTIAQLLQTLDEEYKSGRLIQVMTSTPLVGLSRFVELSLFMIRWALISLMQATG